MGVSLNKEERELKARIDKSLAEGKFVQRKLDTLASDLQLDPTVISKMIRLFPEEYNVSATKKSGLLISSVDRMNKVLAEDEKKLQDLVQGGTEDPEANLDTARKDMLAAPEKVQTDWSSIGHNTSHCYLVLQRTLRKLPAGRERNVLEMVLRDLESLYVDVCGHQSLPLK